MDTIFVKNVRENSPAYEAGLATGDRIISVNGQTITGHTYAQVVQLIQQSGTFLHLLVVPKEDDILQLYFGETAHNPETNQRPARVKSPEVTEHRYSAGSMLQPGSHRHHHRHHSSQQHTLQPSTENSPEVWSSQSPPEGLVIGSENRGTSTYRIGLDPTWYRSRCSKTAPGRRSSEGPALTRRDAVYGYVPVTSPDFQTVRNSHYISPSGDRRFSSDNSTRVPGSSVGSVFKPLQIVDDRRLVSSDVTASGGSASLYSTIKSDNCHNLLPLQRQQFVATSSPPSDSMASSRYGSSENVHSSSNSLQGLCYPGAAGCRLSLDGGRRESSVSLPSSSVHDNFTSDGSKDSLLSCDSTSTLTGGQDGCSSDDSVIISRIRKSFEQKEEFLKRPNKPISWNFPENDSNEELQKIVPHGASSHAIIAREFYARPQKFQRPVWPPQNLSNSPSPSSYRQQSPSRSSGSGKINHSTVSNNKPTHQNLRRVKSDIDSERDSSASRGSEVRSAAVLERAASEPCEDHKSRGHFICGGPVTNVPPPVISKGMFNQTTDSAGSQFRPIMPVAGTTSGGNHRHASGKTAFVTTLSRIHENIPASDSVSDFLSATYPSSKVNDGYEELHKNGETSSLPPSLHSSPIADSLHFSRSLSSPTDEKEGSSRYPQHPMLQLVSRRARQFETGVLDDDQSPSDRTSLYRSELSRLSAKKSVPNVAVRKREFESRAGSSNSSTIRESRRPNRESRSLESAEPPPSAQDDPTSAPVKLRVRSNSAESWAAATTLNRSRNVLDWPPTRTQDPEPQRHKAVRQDSYLAAVKTPVSTDEERLGRRVSYLKATWGDRMHVDSDLDLSDGEAPNIPHHSDSHYAALDQPIELNGKETLAVVREGSLHCKVTLIDGKRASDRSWKLVWAILRGPILGLCKERRDLHQSAQTPIVQNEGEQQIDMRSSQIEIAEDYTKRKHVLRVNTSTGSEVLLQAEDADDMNQWLVSLNGHAQQSEEIAAVDSKKQALLQQTSPNARLSPLPGHKGIKKFTALRNRSPTGQAAITKTRKQSQSDQLPSPKHKTWKGRVARQFRRIQHGASSPNSPTSQHPDNVTFGIPLEECTPSSFYMYVPLLVELCATVVDKKGLDVMGIYRVPGNTAAVSALTELLSKGFDEVALQDNRWQDVNVISSLLKLFFRKLPDALLTSELYSSFIEADKIEDPNKRMAAIKKLVYSLPDWHFETLKYLLFHLKRVVDHSERNKMEARNLAIVFGPTLVRTADGDMVTMVTDMSHQCRIVESLISHVEWFYAVDDEAPESSFPAIPVQEPPEVEPTTTNHNLLLNNISKVQGIKTESPSRDINAKVLVSSIISAANRKIQKSRSRKSTIGSTSAADEAESGESAEEKKTGCDVKLKTTSESHSAVDDSSQHPSSAVASSIIESVILSGDIVKHLQANDEGEKTESTEHDNDQPKKWPSESLPKTSCEDGTIRTYAGLSATTQERIRRFELETKANLQRDQTRHRHEQLEAEKLRIEHQLQQAKKDLETEDTLDKIADSISDVRKTRLKANDEDVLHLQHLSLLDRRPIFNETSNLSSNPYVATRSRMRPSSVPVEDQIHSETAYSEHFSKVEELPGCAGGGDVSHITDLGGASSKSFLKDPSEKQNSSVPLCMSEDCSKITNESGLSKRQSYVDHEYEQIEVEDVGQPAVRNSANVPEEKAEESSKSNQWDSGSDLLASLTSTFDRKLKSLLYTSSSIPCSSASGKPLRDPTLQETDDGEDMQDLESGINKSQMPSVCISNKRGFSITSTSFRDPSLHRGRSVLLEPQSRVQLPADFDDGGNGEELASQEDDKEWGNPQKILVDYDVDEEVGSEDKEGSRRKLKSVDTLVKNEKSDSIVNNARQKHSEIFSKTEKEESPYNNSKLRRSESLTKTEKVPSYNTKLRRSESLTKTERADSLSNTKLKRSDSLTKTEKTESNNSKRKQDLLLSSSIRNSSRGCNKEKENMAINLTKLKRKNGMPERSIKRRHTVGGTKDFDKLNWLDNRIQQQQQDEMEAASAMNKERQCLRTSSPDLSSSRFGGNIGRERFLVEIRMLGSGGIMAELRPHITSTTGRPRSLPDPNLASRVFKVPLESHV